MIITTCILRIHNYFTVLEVVVPYSPDIKIAIFLQIIIIIWVIHYKLVIMVHEQARSSDGGIGTALWNLTLHT